MKVERASFCKVNLLLNILGKRPDGYHNLETILQPVALCDRLEFTRAGKGIALTCSDAALPADASNLVWRAAAAFLTQAGITEGVRIHLEKRIPMAAGLGGGSGNAAATLLALNELFGHPISPEMLDQLAAGLGSDVPFFLQAGPALGTGRGEKIQALGAFPALVGTAILLVHPGFGVSTPWAYSQLARYPAALNGEPKRAQRMLEKLQSASAAEALKEAYNSLEAPVLPKYPLLSIFQSFMQSEGALMAMMSGSGSTTFGMVSSLGEAEKLREKFLLKFGANFWTAVACV